MTTRELVENAPIQADRVDWARRGSSQYVSIKLLCLVVNDGDLAKAAVTLDDWAKASDSQIVEIQRVFRRGIHVLYARLA